MSLATTAPAQPRQSHGSQQPSRAMLWRIALKSVLGVSAVLAVAIVAEPLAGPAHLTLTVFAAAIALWSLSSVNDTYVALGAVTVLVVANVVTAEQFFAPLGSETTWLLIGAFIVAGAVTTTGLAERAALALSARARTPHHLVHIVAALVTATAFVVPATSGRAALLLPVFVALAAQLPPQLAWLRRILALIIPTVVLFSAAATLIGAGAHLITVEMLAAAGLPTFSFVQWLWFALPYALLMAHISAEVIYRLYARPGFEAAHDLQIQLQAAPGDCARPVAGSIREFIATLDAPQRMAATVVIGAGVLWISEPLHNLHAALVAIIAALLLTAPGIGVAELSQAVKKIPWNLLIFMAATVALAQALITSGVADSLETILGTAATHDFGPVLFIWAVIAISSLAHLVIQSRSARSAVFIPVVLSIGPVLGVNPVAAALCSTIAAGLCHTMPAAAKPLAIFAHDAGPTFRRDLLVISAVLGPLHIALCGLCALFLWPFMGLDLFL